MNRTKTRRRHLMTGAYYAARLMPFWFVEPLFPADMTPEYAARMAAFLRGRR